VGRIYIKNFCNKIKIHQCSKNYTSQPNRKSEKTTTINKEQQKQTIKTNQLKKKINK